MPACRIIRHVDITYLLTRLLTAGDGGKDRLKIFIILGGEGEGEGGSPTGLTVGNLGVENWRGK